MKPCFNLVLHSHISKIIRIGILQSYETVYKPSVDWELTSCSMEGNGFERACFFPEVVIYGIGIVLEKAPEEDASSLENGLLAFLKNLSCFLWWTAHSFGITKCGALLAISG